MNNARPFQPSENIKAESAAWLARLRADDRSVEDERAFQEWLALGPAHAAAFEAVSMVWEISGAVPRDLRGRCENRRPAPHRRQVMAGLAALTVGAGTLSVWHSAEAGVYQTEVGEQKHVVLDDGSQVFLDTETRIKVGFSNKLRAAELIYGRANFRVTPDIARPFIVSAADRRIVSGASSFDIRRDNKLVSVILIEGSAVIQSATPGGGSEVLHSGERLFADAAKIRGRDKPNLAPLLAWQTGRAIFENEKLSDAIDEMNRYSTDKLLLENGTIAGMRVSGVYVVGDNVAFANSISKLLPVKMRRDGSRVYLSPDPARLM